MRNAELASRLVTHIPFWEYKSRAWAKIPHSVFRIPHSKTLWKIEFGNPCFARNFVEKYPTMTALERAKAILPDMSQSEIAKLVQMASSRISEDFPGIEKTPGVCGGSACIIRTRIPVWSIIEYMQIGVGKDKLLQNFPTLRAQDLANAWAYYTVNKDEIEREIKENNED